MSLSGRVLLCLIIKNLISQVNLFKRECEFNRLKGTFVYEKLIKINCKIFITNRKQRGLFALY